MGVKIAKHTPTPSNCLLNELHLFTNALLNSDSSKYYLL